MSIDGSPYLNQPLRSLQDVLRERGNRDKPPAVLIVEDEATVAMELVATVAGMGCRPMGPFATAEAAIAAARIEAPDLVLMDVRLESELTGIDAALAIMEQSPTSIIFVTANPQEIDEHDLDLMGARVVEKPFSERQLQFAVVAVLGKRLQGFRPGAAAELIKLKRSV